MILEKTTFQYLIGYPPSEDLTRLEHPVFYKDKSNSFKRTSLYGMDLTLLVLNCMVMNAADIVLGHRTMLGLFCMYVVEWVVIWFRNTYGEENISKKTLIDERFLI